MKVLVGLVVAGTLAALFFGFFLEGPKPNSTQVPVSLTSTKSMGPKPCGGPWPTNIIKANYLVIGGGPAGSQTAHDLTKALNLSGSNAKVVLIEARDRIGGNFWDADLIQPVGYTGPKLKIGMGGLRVNMLTLLNERRLCNEYNIPLLFTPFRQHMFSRGRSVLCKEPSPDQTFTDFCSYSSEFINTSAGSAFQGLEATVPAGDPGYDAWCFLLDSEDYTAADAGCPVVEVSGLPLHPLLGLVCDDTHSDPHRWCPRKACSHFGPDFKSFIQQYLSPEYAKLLEDDNVGFKGDYIRSFNACSYLRWQTREWNTASNNGMPVGGMSEIPKRAAKRAEEFGASVYLSQPATCVRRAASGKGYEVRTPDYTFRITEWVFAAIPNVDLHRIESLEGDIIEELRAKNETRFARNASVAVVSMQWAPNEPAWYYDYLDKVNGNWSLRQYGDLACFSRNEFWDTPYHRFHNGMRMVYSDGHCKEMWDDLIRHAEAQLATGMPLLEAYEHVTAVVMEGLKQSFPGASIPMPVWVRGATWEHAWYFGEPLQNFTNSQVAEFAMAPLGNGEKIALIGDAWNTDYSGHAESAFISSRNALTQPRFATGVLQAKLNEIYAARDAIIANDFDALTACPSGLSNEYCGPYGPYKLDGTLHHPYCVGNTGADSGYTCVSP